MGQVTVLHREMWEVTLEEVRGICHGIGGGRAFQSGDGGTMTRDTEAWELRMCAHRNSPVHWEVFLELRSLLNSAIELYELCLILSA